MRRASALVLVFATVACGLMQRPSLPALGVSNGTTIPVVVWLNGERLAEVAPSAESGAEASEVQGLPALPWHVEVRTQSGRTLTAIDVHPGDITSTVTGDQRVRHGVADRVDLSCGTLRVWAGDVMPSGPQPPENPGQPGDCEP